MRSSEYALLQQCTCSKTSKNKTRLPTLVLNCKYPGFLLNNRSTISVKTTPTQIAWHQRLTILEYVYTDLEKRFLPRKTWHLKERDRQVRVKRGKRHTGVTCCAQGHAASQNQRQAENPKPQIKCLTHYIMLSLSPSHQRYMQLFKEYF